MPSPDYQKFPSKKERKELIEKLMQEAQMGNLTAADEHYKNYINSLKQLNETMDRYYTPDEDGVLPALGEEQKNELMTAILQTANLGETFLASVASKGNSLKAGVPNAVQKVQGFLSQDYETLSLYNPEEDEMTLAEIQQQARSQVIDLRGIQIGKLGYQQSSRLPMTVVDETGKQRQGVFTKASRVSVLSPVKKTLEKATEACEDPTVKEQIKNVIEGYRQHLQKKGILLTGKVEPKNANDEMIVGRMMQDLMWGEVANPTVLFKNAGVNVDGLGDKAAEILLGDFDKYKEEPSFWVNGLELGLKEGDRIDQRNSAMSAVAGLLGVPKLVAHSTNMKYLDEDGNEVEGTFMDFADGLDLKNDKEQHLFSQVSDNPFDAPESNLSKDIADLQVLDFICGNIDRHAGNLFYKVDEKSGKITGVQGIDNDSAFGLFSSGKNGENFRLQGTESLKVISESMAKKVRKISPEMLKFTLRGRGLTEQEIEAACSRLQEVKEAVKEAVVAEDAVKMLANGKKLSVMSSETLRKLPPPQ